MQRILCLLTVFATAVLAHKAPAQLAAINEEPPYLTHGRYVIQQGAEWLDSQLVSIVAQSLRPRLPKWPKNLDQGSVTVTIEDEGINLQGTRIAKLSVGVRQDKLQPTEAEMQELWDLTRGQLGKELQRVAELAYEAQHVRLDRELREQQDQREKLEAQAAGLAEELAMLEADTAGADRDTLAKAIAEAVSNLRGLQLEDAGLRAHRQAIEQRIDELRKMAAQEGDPIVEELQRIVEIREEARQRLEEAKNKAAPNAIPKDHFLEAEGKIAEAKIELLRARREAEDRSSGGALRELTKELSKLMVESAKIEGQRKQLEKTVAELRKQVRETAQAAAKLARLQAEMQQIHNRRQQIENQISNLRQSLDQQSEPEITLQPLVDDKASQAGEPEASAPGGSGSDEAPPEGE